MSRAWPLAVRRGIVPILAGLVCLALSRTAQQSLAPVFQGLGAILLVLGVIIVLATARTLRSEEKRIGPRVSNR